MSVLVFSAQRDDVACVNGFGWGGGHAVHVDRVGGHAIQIEAPPACDVRARNGACGRQCHGIEWERMLTFHAGSVARDEAVIR